MSKRTLIVPAALKEGKEAEFEKTKQKNWCEPLTKAHCSLYNKT